MPVTQPALTPAPQRTTADRLRHQGRPLAFAMQPGSFSPDERTLDVVIYAGSKVDRFVMGERVTMRLDMSPGAGDLSRLNNGAPFLLQHGNNGFLNGGSSSVQVGRDALLGRFVPGSVRLEDEQLIGTVQFVPEELAEARGVEPVIQEIVQGFRPNVSLGFNMWTVKLEAESEDGPDEYVVTRWEGLEGSSVLMAADDQAGYLSANDFMTGQDDPALTAQIEQLASQVSELHAALAATPAPQSNEEATVPDTQSQPTTDPTAPPAAPQPAIDFNAERQRIREQEQQTAAERTEQILLCAQKLGLSVEDGLRLVQKKVTLSSGGERYLTVDEARAELVDLRADRADEVPTSGVQPGGVELGAEDSEKRAQGIQNAILHRAMPSEYGLNDNGRRFAGLRLSEIARGVVAEHYGPEQANRLNSIRIGEVALSMRSERTTGTLLGAEELALSTSDFPYILADVAHKMLRRGYEAAPRTFVAWCQRGTAPDYRDQNEPILDGASAIDDVTENGTYQEGSVKEGKEKWSVARRGIIIRLTPEMIANDDLDAFTLIPLRIGDSAAHKETAIVYGLLTDNGQLAEDSTALFHANHDNLVSAGAGAPSGTQMATMRALARKQTNRQSQILNITLPHVILPAAHEGIVEQITDPAFSPTSASNAPTQFMRTRQYHVEPLLDATSEDQWYMAADPNRVSTLKYGYLQGAEGVSISQELDFDSSGLKIKGEHHFGAGVMDYRGLYRNNGA